MDTPQIFAPTGEVVTILAHGFGRAADGRTTSLRTLIRFADGRTDRVNPSCVRPA